MTRQLLTLANLVTLINLFCGCMALWRIFEGDYVQVPILLGVCLLADFLDGLVARALHQSGPVGKELDSLADMVSFGVVPGAMLFSILQDLDMAFPYMGFALSCFAALRLAKFNIDTRQTTDFLGLATPACTALVLGIYWWFYALPIPAVVPFITSLHVVLLMVVLMGLLVSDVPMFSFKLKSKAWRDNIWQLLLLISAIILLIWLKFAALPLIVGFYILLSIAKNLTTK